MPRKGSFWERWLCYHLSEWWTGDPDGCVFWRSSQSGGRATVRSRKGLKTSGHSGDIVATDPCAIPFTTLVTIECKRGYPHVNLHSLLDKPKTAAVQEFEKWIEQVETSRKSAGSVSWLIIHKRDGRLPYVIFPSSLMDILLEHGCFTIPTPFCTIHALIRRLDGGKMTIHLCATTLDKFLRRVSRSDVERIIRRLEHEQGRD